MANVSLNVNEWSEKQLVGVSWAIDEEPRLVR